MLELKDLKGLDQVRLPVLKAALDKIFGEDSWKDLEPETISIQMGAVFSPLMMDKIRVLQVLDAEKELFYNDVLFFLYSTEVINNEPADFEVTPVPTSLEMAFAIAEIMEIYPGDFANSVKQVITYMLNEEGYSVPVGIFASLVDPLALSPGQTQEDTRDKELAIKLYLQGMIHGKH